MARTAALYLLPAVLVASAWARLEDGTRDSTVIGLLLLALLPALVRPWWGRLVAGVAVAFYAVEVIYDLSPPGVAGLGDRFRDGFLAFYDVPQPFAVPEHPLMHGVVLCATFGFALGVALAIAARRPLVASFVLLVGSVWPSTLVPGDDLARGAVTLAAVLALLAFGERRPARSLRPALVSGALLVAAAVAASTSAAVAKPEIVRWQDWDLYDKPAAQRGVNFVWNAQYGGITWPEEEVTMLTVSGPNRNLYWRATTLDVFEDNRWIEVLPAHAAFEGGLFLRDPLVPTRPRSQWIRSDVRVEGLLDDHLVGPSMPVAYEVGDREAFVAAGGVATAETMLPRGAEYSVWSFAPQPTPRQLARADWPNNTRFLARYLELGSPPGYRRLFDEARRVVGDPQNAYTAVVTLEAWFRSEGGFTYDEAPPRPGALPPLVDFVLESKRGYCQHYAGAMALMLRSLDIPARVAVGFTSGTPNEDRTVWTVTNLDAHAWVEVWFRGWGWIPFDPTPGRGQLSGPYSNNSPDFDFAQAAGVLGLSGGGGVVDRLRQSLSERQAGEQFQQGRGGGGGVAPVIRERGASLLKLLFIVAAAAAAGIALVKRGVRARRAATRDPRRLAMASRREVLDFLLDQGVEVPRSATPRELSAQLKRLFAVDGDAFAAALAAARYAPPRESRTASRLLRRELRGVLQGLRASIGVPRRLRGAVSLKSLAA